MRANQGRSADIKLTCDRARPPDVLYHGTAKSVSNLDSILRTVLAKMRRHHVHLTADAVTAAMVGSRHGKVIVMAVAAARMSESGFEFYLSANGVWLVDSDPPEYLSVACRE